MGKMKMNSGKFAPVPAHKAEIISNNMQDNTDFELSSMNYGNSYQVNSSQDGNNIQIKTDMISNIVGDICGSINEIIKTIGMIRVEEEKTRQVKAAAKARIKMAEEQTKQVQIQETALTERIKSQYLMEIQKAEINLQKELAVIQNEKERILSNERIFKCSLEKIGSQLDAILANNRIYLSQNIQCDFEMIYQMNEQLLRLTEQIVTLHRESRK